MKISNFFMSSNYMTPTYNNEKYYALISEKYNNSIKNYKRKLINKDDPDNYLMLYESMNVYPVYPKPIIMPLKKQGETYEIEMKLSNSLKIDTTPMDKLSQEVDKKIEEHNSYSREFKKIKNVPKTRRFFDYEIRDAVKATLKNDNISNAWIKMYEILVTYNLLNDHQSVNTFHICEHPGAFVHAINSNQTPILKFLNQIKNF